MAQIIVPQQRQKRDAIDVLLAGLQAAQTVYGIKTDMAKLDDYKQNQELARAKNTADIGKTDAETAYYKAQTAAKGDDSLSQAEFLKHVGGKDANWDIAKPDDPNAINFKLNNGSSVSLIPKRVAEKPAEWEVKPYEYMADDGKNRIGAIAINKSGQTKWIQSPTDPMATKQPEGPNSKISEAERGTVDKAAMGLEAIGDMQKAMNDVASKPRVQQAYERFSIIKATPYTEARDRYVEAIGRLQSGGAINKDEESRFLRFVPGPTDDNLLSNAKLNHAYTELASRLKTRGFDPEQVLAQRKEISKKAPQLNGLQDTSGTAIGAPVKSIKDMSIEELRKELGQ